MLYIIKHITVCVYIIYLSPVILCLGAFCVSSTQPVARFHLGGSSLPCNLETYRALFWVIPGLPH